MARTKSATKKQLFEDEEFDLQQNDDTLQENEEEPIEEEPNLDEIVVEEEEVSPADLEELVAVDHEDDVLAADAEKGVHLPEGEEAEAETEEETETKSVVTICPHCHEEVLDMEVCPLCGNPLKLTADTEIVRDEDFDPLADYLEEDEEDGSFKKKKKTDLTGLDDDILFNGLTSYNSDQYTPVANDNNI